jgi:diguanylate cyclase (GGDEF)-like protein
MTALAGEPEFADVLMSTYPSFCELPPRDHTRWQQAVAGGAEAGDQVIVVGGCFLGTSETIPPTDQVRICRLDQCFYLFTSRTLVDHYMREGAYLLTPGWLEAWPHRMAQWRFDQSTARQFFGECATKLVLLDTSVNPESARQLQELAAFLDLPAETVPIGLDHVRLSMRQLILEWRQDQSAREIKTAFARANQKAADATMALDLLANLASLRTEAEVVAGILDVFSMLFSPRQVVYVPVDGDQLGIPQAHPVSDTDMATLQAWLASNAEAHAWLPDGNGFRLRLMYQAATVALLEVAGVTFPEYKHQYLNLALAMARLCGLAVVNARLFQQVQQAANTDALTGLFSRRFFFQLAEAEWARAQRYGRPLSALMFDVDHFKQVNDTYGHGAGDRVLALLADCCRHTLRASDVCGRYGGDEFVVLLPETVPPNAFALAERLRRSIAAASIVGSGHPLRVTISLGVAALNPQCASLDDLLNRCDKALYVAKARGRNSTQCWEP